MGEVTIRLKKQTRATVAQNQTKSEAIDCRRLAYGLLEIPSSMDGTAITFEASAREYADTQAASDISSSDFKPVRDKDNTLLTLTFTAGALMEIPYQVLAGRFFKIVCGTSQTTERTFYVALSS